MPICLWRVTRITMTVQHVSVGSDSRALPWPEDTIIFANTLSVETPEMVEHMRRVCGDKFGEFRGTRSPYVLGGFWDRDDAGSRSVLL